MLDQREQTFGIPAQVIEVAGPVVRLQFRDAFLAQLCDLADALFTHEQRVDQPRHIAASFCERRDLDVVKQSDVRGNRVVRGIERWCGDDRAKRRPLEQLRGERCADRLVCTVKIQEGRASRSISERALPIGDLDEPIEAPCGRLVNRARELRLVATGLAISSTCPPVAIIASARSTPR